MMLICRTALVRDDIKLSSDSTISRDNNKLRRRFSPKWLQFFLRSIVQRTLKLRLNYPARRINKHSSAEDVRVLVLDAAIPALSEMSDHCGLLQAIMHIRNATQNQCACFQIFMTIQSCWVGQDTTYCLFIPVRIFGYSLLLFTSCKEWRNSACAVPTVWDWYS